MNADACPAPPGCSSYRATLHRKFTCRARDLTALLLARLRARDQTALLLARLRARDQTALLLARLRLSPSGGAARPHERSHALERGGEVEAMQHSHRLAPLRARARAHHCGPRLRPACDSHTQHIRFCWWPASCAPRADSRTTLHNATAAVFSEVHIGTASGFIARMSSPTAARCYGLPWQLQHECASGRAGFEGQGLADLSPGTRRAPGGRRPAPLPPARQRDIQIRRVQLCSALLDRLLDGVR